jgi:predicted GNAT family N-acyltransferase
MDFKFIDIKDEFYNEAVLLRIRIFFEGMPNASDLINDTFEIEGIHLICLNNNKVIGTGRLNFEENESIISQMAIEKDFQYKGVGSKILNKLIEYSKGKTNSRITLNARETAIAFYEKFNFIIIGDKYPSKKTTIIHQKMELK